MVNKMDHEIISIQTAEALANYKKLQLERKNIVQFLKNSIAQNIKLVAIHKGLKNKEQQIVAQAKIGQAQELLHILGEDHKI